MEKHDYHDTLDEIVNAEDKAKQAQQAADHKDAEIAYETLAVSSSMGMFGMEQEAANLIQLQLAQEVLYKAQQEYNGDESDVSNGEQSDN